MSKILFLGKNVFFLQKCAERLRWKGHDVLVHNDVFDGLREMMIFNVSCIVWDVDTNEPSRTRKYQAIQRYHRYTPVVIIDDHREAYEQDLDRDTYFMTNNPAVDELVNKIVDLVPPRVVYSEENAYNNLEKEYGMSD